MAQEHVVELGPPVADGVDASVDGSDAGATTVVDKRAALLMFAQVVLLLFIFLVGIRGLSTGFKGLGSGVLDAFFMATKNPFVGLVVGILATTVVQSSSVTTSMIVALVAAPNSPLPIENAIPMVMGANIGTTVTNTLVSLGHVGRPAEFRRAFAAATCHDFFNFMAVAVLLPLEIATGFLSTASRWIALSIGIGGPGKLPNPIKSATGATLEPLVASIQAVSPSQLVASLALIIISGLIIFTALLLIVRTLRALAETKLKSIVSRSLGKNGYIGIIVGIVVTVMVQSSSITTSVLVPLAAAGILTLEQAFPITLGANIGTTITAIVASAAAPPETAHLAVQIAAVHFLFNVAGIGLIYPFKTLRQIPLRMARWLAEVATHSKRHAVIYVLTLFYGMPAALIFISSSV